MRGEKASWPTCRSSSNRVSVSARSQGPSGITFWALPGRRSLDEEVAKELMSSIDSSIHSARLTTLLEECYCEYYRTVQIPAATRRSLQMTRRRCTLRRMTCIQLPYPASVVLWHHSQARHARAINRTDLVMNEREGPAPPHSAAPPLHARASGRA